MKEYTAMVMTVPGGTAAVTVKAKTNPDAQAKLKAQGYHSIVWIIPAA